MDSAGPDTSHSSHIRRADEPLSAADASNIEIDAADQVNAFLLAGVLGFGGFVSPGGIDLDVLRAAVAARLADPVSPRLARFTQRVDVEHRPLAWRACEPDLIWHVRQSDPVDGQDGLAALAATLMTVPMPLDRPLWELLVVPGASAAGVGVILRLHHAVADGVEGVRLVHELFGATPTGRKQESDQSRSSDPRKQSAPRRRRSWRTMATSVSRVTAVFRATVPRTVLLGPIGPRRGVALVDVDLDDLAVAARSRGATVNDALLAAVGEAVAAALRSDGQPVPAVLPASVPVALPDRGSSGNAVGVMLIRLPTDEPDPERRLARIAADTRSAKDAARAQGTFELTRSRWGSRLFSWLARRQHFVALFVTNVRGPSEPLTIAGAPLERAWPVAPIQGNVRCGVAAMSYAGRLGIALHADAAALRVAEARRALEAELSRMLEVGGPTRR